MFEGIDRKKIIILVLLLVAGFLLDDFIEERNQPFDESYGDENKLDQGSEKSSLEEEGDNIEVFIYVHIAGEVASPGVYELEEGTRLNQLLKLAGEKDSEIIDKYFNRARVLRDGEKIYIASRKEIEEESGDEGFAVGDLEADDRVNINLADKDELMSLSGIGEKRAEDIIAYREKKGRFEAEEDIKEVSGIGERIYANIKDRITT